MTPKEEEDVVFDAVKRTHGTNPHQIAGLTGLTVTQVDQALRRMRAKIQKENKDKGRR